MQQLSVQIMCMFALSRMRSACGSAALAAAPQPETLLRNSTSTYTLQSCDSRLCFIRTEVPAARPKLVVPLPQPVLLQGVHIAGTVITAG